MLCLGFISISKDVRIGIFYKDKLTKATIQYNVGRYEFFSESMAFPFLNRKTDKINFIAKGNKVLANLNGKKLSENYFFRLEKQTDLNSLLVSNGKYKRAYQGNIVVYAINGKLKIINEINIDKYVEGVIKGEAGYGYELEYYKVQAVISRTYALFHQKHKKQGYDLCDHTHCQVYKGINNKKQITEAVSQTSEEVIVDSNLNYINTLFHSNCGGQTTTTDKIWNKKLPCMESIKDTFCRNSSQANWKRTITKSSWIKFLSNKTGKSTSYFQNQNFNFNQYSRKEYYKIGKTKVRLTRVRSYYKLKSTYFSVHDIGDKIVFIGKGYGHGAGLCQEGGIVMSKTHDYKTILHFYYQNISIMNISKVEYYRLF